jgi:catechol 2,3-dioxygenase-like lactoylglutathione lyase family enzyme
MSAGRGPAAGLLAPLPIFVNLPATDIARARRWYEDALGLPRAMELGAGLLFETGGAPFLVHPSTVASGEGTAASWVVGDVDLAMASLRARGVRFEAYAIGGAPVDIASGFAPMVDGGSAAWFRDSEGNLLSIHQLPFDLSLADLATGRRAGGARI